MANLAPMMVAATVLSAGSSIMGGNAANRSAQSEASQLEYQAGQQRASSQRAAIEQRRQAALVNSRLRAVAGGGAGDIGVINMAADIAGEGEYRALTALYEGNDKAAGMESAAAARRREGKAARTSGYLGAVSSVLSAAGTSSMLSKYGAGGFSGMPDSVPTRGGK